MLTRQPFVIPQAVEEILLLVDCRTEDEWEGKVPHVERNEYNSLTIWADQTFGPLSDHKVNCDENRNHDSRAAYQ